MHNKSTTILKLIDELIQSAKDAGKHGSCLDSYVTMRRRWLLEELGVEFKDARPLEGVEMEVGDE